MSINFKLYSLVLVVLCFFSCKEEKQSQNKADSSPSTETQSQKAFGGLALYTVRDAMSTAPKETLKQVAEAGYAYIEDAGYADGQFYGMTPTEYKTVLKDLNLTPISSHQSGITFDNADKTIADLKAVGFEYLVIPIPPMGTFTYDNKTHTMGMTGGVENLTKTLQILGAKCYEAGLKLVYHNHDFEFKANADGIVPIDYMLDHTDPKFVNFQLDLFWATKADADPLAYFEKYPNRFKMWHVKDMDAEGRFAPVGNGTIDFAKILAKKKQSGMTHYFVEQDQTFNTTPLDAIKISHDGLKKFGFN